MAWIILILSGAFESVWAIALSKAEGFTRLWPSVAVFAALAISMGGMAVALMSLPVFTAYAVWVGVGALISILYSFAAGEEAVTLCISIFLLMIVAGIMCLLVVN